MKLSDSVYGSHRVGFYPVCSLKSSECKAAEKDICCIFGFMGLLGIYFVQYNECKRGLNQRILPNGQPLEQMRCVFEISNLLADCSLENKVVCAC